MPGYDPRSEQLLHVGFKAAAKMGSRFLALLVYFGRSSFETAALFQECACDSSRPQPMPMPLVGCS